MSVSVGICAYNEGLNIGPLLSNVLYEQELSSESEVLVVCSGCTDNTVSIVQEFAEKDKRIKIIVENERQGKASAVNQVLKNANGDSLIFISADTMPYKKCFTKLISRLQVPSVGVVCARPQPINNSKSLADKLVRVLWSFHDHVFREVSNAGIAKHASEVYCIRKNIANSIPPETINDDAFIALTAKNKGWSICYESESVVSICGPETIPDYIRQRRRVIFGHHQIKKLTGEPPQYFVPLLRLDKKRRRHLIYSLFNEFDIATILTFISIELLLNALTIFDAVIGKSYSMWNVAYSTKKILSSELNQ